MRRKPTMVLALTAALLVTGCSNSPQQQEDAADPLQVVANPVAATAAASPDPAATPAGTVLAAGGKVTAMLASPETGTLTVALTEPNELRLYDLADLQAPARTVALPGRVDDLTLAGTHVLAAVPSGRTLLRVPLAERGDAEPIAIGGAPAATARHGERTLVSLADQEAVTVREGGAVSKRMTGDLYSAGDIVVADGRPFVLDPVRTALFRLDVAGGAIREGLRAGMGATNAVADDYGRVLVADTRGGALLAFSSDPFLLRQRYPVPGGIYGIAYDARRDLAWVTLTGRNEVVGFDMRGGQPTEKLRFPTVRQPNSVTVDPQTGRVVVGSAAGEGLQVIDAMRQP